MSREIRLDIIVNSRDALDSLRDFQNSADQVKDTLETIARTSDRAASGLATEAANLRGLIAEMGQLRGPGRIQIDIPETVDLGEIELIGTDRFFTRLQQAIATTGLLNIFERAFRITVEQQPTVTPIITDWDPSSLRSVDVTIDFNIDTVNRSVQAITGFITTSINRWITGIPDRIRGVLSAPERNPVNIPVLLDIQYPAEGHYTLRTRLDLGEGLFAGGMAPPPQPPGGFGGAIAGAMGFEAQLPEMGGGEVEQAAQNAMNSLILRTRRIESFINQYEARAVRALAGEEFQERGFPEETEFRNIRRSRGRGRYVEFEARLPGEEAFARFQTEPVSRPKTLKRRIEEFAEGGLPLFLQQPGQQEEVVQVEAQQQAIPPGQFINAGGNNFIFRIEYTATNTQAFQQAVEEIIDRVMMEFGIERA
jgi:hypothetical protein